MIELAPSFSSWSGHSRDFHSIAPVIVVNRNQWRGFHDSCSCNLRYQVRGGTELCAWVRDAVFMDFLMLPVQGRMVSVKSINEIRAHNMGRRHVSSMPSVIPGHGKPDRCVSISPDLSRCRETFHAAGRETRRYAGST